MSENVTNPEKNNPQLPYILKALYKLTLELEKKALELPVNRYGKRKQSV